MFIKVVNSGVLGLKFEILKYIEKLSSQMKRGFRSEDSEEKLKAKIAVLQAAANAITVYPLDDVEALHTANQEKLIAAKKANPLYKEAIYKSKTLDLVLQAEAYLENISQAAQSPIQLNMKKVASEDRTNTTDGSDDQGPSTSGSPR